jgi:hypothetical protein
MSIFILTFLHVHCRFVIAALEKTGCLDKNMNFFVVQYSKGYTNCASKPISTFSIFYYPFFFIIHLLSVLSENALVRQLAN